MAVANANGYEQVNFQVPIETSDGATNIRVTNRGIVREFFLRGRGSPGIFVENGRPIIHRASDWSRVTPENPAAPGEVIVIYATGFTTWPRIPNGFPAPLMNPPECRGAAVRIGGRAARVLFCGLAPGFVGLNQLNIEVPRESPSGELDLVVPGGHAVHLPVR